METREAMQLYENFLVRNGNSDNVRRMYRRRVEVFLDVRPDALEADGEKLRAVCDEYVSGLPVNSATEVAATAVRHFWTMVSGRPYHERLMLSGFERDELIEAEVEAFGAWPGAEGTVGEVVLEQRLRTARQMPCSTFAPGTFDRRSMDVNVVRRHISERSVRLAPSTVGRVVTDIRSYAKLLVACGVGPARQVALLPLKAPSRARNVGPVMGEGDYEAILSKTEGDGARELRDRAMVPLMGNLGLRASDVAGLTLDDVNWTRGPLRVRQSKSVSERTIPIDDTTGSAIEAYVTRARGPQGGTRALFMTAGRERGDGPVTSRQVIRAVKLIAEKAGVRGYHGAHSLRRAVATGMVCAGAPVEVVADVLGHESIQTTMRHLQVDVASLAWACSPWPMEVAR